MWYNCHLFLEMTKIPSFLYFTFLFLILLSSCKSKKNTLFNTGKEGDRIDLPVYVMQNGSDSLYLKEQIIAPGDQLLIQNLQNENLITQGSGSSQGMQNIQSSGAGAFRYRVENDGSVLVPVLGRVLLGGLSRVKAQERLNELYKTELLKDPIITLSIANLQVTMLGEFGKQGNFILDKDQVSLIQMLGEAGGLNTRANKKRIKIIRGDYRNPHVFIVDLSDINSLSDPRLFLRNNDIVYAETKGIFQTLDVLSPATSVLGVGLSVVNVYLLIKTLSN